MAGKRTKEGSSLTPRQQEYVDFVTRFWAKKGYGPSEDDIAEHFLVSAPSAHMMVVRLCAAGALVRDVGVPRSVRPPGHSGKATSPPPGSWVLCV
jgi:hypothetical protein